MISAIDGLSNRIEFFDEVVSTNLTAGDRSYRHGDVVVARSQSAGRGQRGNTWASEPGANLTFSVVLEPAGFAAGRQFHISKIAALAVADTLAAFGVKASVKWPNDIYVGERKIAGILIENNLMDGRVVRSIVGVGMNINQRVFDPSLPNPVSLVQSTGVERELSEVLDIFLVRLDARLGESFDETDCAYRDRLYRGTGEHLFCEPDGEPFLASIEEVKPNGELVLRCGETKKTYLFKEIRFV